MSVVQPVGMRAPESAYTVFYVLFALGTAGTLSWLAFQARRRRSVLPLAAVAGGLAVGLVVPPIYNYLTLVWFPSNIPLPFVTEFGMRDPLFDALGYVLFIGFGGYLLYMLLLKGLGGKAVYATFVLWGVTDLLLELPFLQAGLYRYYGDQPLHVGGFPLYWVFLNGLVPTLAGSLMYLTTERWPCSRRAAAARVAACPALAAGLLMIPMFPVAAALHAEVASGVRVAFALLAMAGSAWTLRWVATVVDEARPDRTVVEWEGEHRAVAGSPSGMR